MHRNTFDTAETLEDAREYAARARTAVRSGFVSADGYIAIISYTMANAFMLRITLNDHADVDFISLLVKYGLFLGITYMLRSYITRNADVVKKLVDVAMYDVIQDLFYFASVLFVVIIVRLIQAYFEFGFEELYSIIFLFVAFSFTIRLGDRFVANARI